MMSNRYIPADLIGIKCSGCGYCFQDIELGRCIRVEFMAGDRSEYRHLLNTALCHDCRVDKGAVSANRTSYRVCTCVYCGGQFDDEALGKSIMKSFWFGFYDEAIRLVESAVCADCAGAVRYTACHVLQNVTENEDGQ